jgi:hypothetical protein
LKKIKRLLYDLVLFLGIKPYYVYTITSVKLSKKWGTDTSRCWIWVATKEDAIKSAMIDTGWYSEYGYYDYIVIEKYEYGTYASEDNIWIQINFDYKNRTHNPKIVDVPKQAKQIFNFGIG